MNVTMVSLYIAMSWPAIIRFQKKAQTDLDKPSSFFRWACYKDNLRGYLSDRDQSADKNHLAVRNVG